jgi:hypothetical protein
VIVKRERRKHFDQRGHWKKKRRSLGREGFFEDQSSRLLGLVFCLVMIVVFH